MNEMRDFVFKIYTRNSEPEFIQSEIQDISEAGMSGFMQPNPELRKGDEISGVIEGEKFHIKIRYSGTVVWTEKKTFGFAFGVEFKEEILLPDILIARLMAVA